MSFIHTYPQVIHQINISRETRFLWNKTRTGRVLSGISYLWSIGESVTGSFLTQSPSTPPRLDARDSGLRFPFQNTSYLCGHGESNPELVLGKDALYHLTMTACAYSYSTATLLEKGSSRSIYNTHQNNCSLGSCIHS